MKDAFQNLLSGLGLIFSYCPFSTLQPSDIAKSDSTRMSAPSSTSLPVGNKDFTHATVVIIGAGVSGMLRALGHTYYLITHANFTSRNMHGDRFDQT